MDLNVYQSILNYVRETSYQARSDDFWYDCLLSSDCGMPILYQNKYKSIKDLEKVKQQIEKELNECRTVHRDLNYSNITENEDEEIFVIDWDPHSCTIPQTDESLLELTQFLTQKDRFEKKKNDLEYTKEATYQQLQIAFPNSVEMQGQNKNSAKFKLILKSLFTWTITLYTCKSKKIKVFIKIQIHFSFCKYTIISFFHSCTNTIIVYT